MSEVEGLIGRLKSLAEEWHECCGDIHEPLEEAATALANLTAERDALQARVGELEAGLRMATDLIDCIKQSSANVWWVDATDPETAVCDTYSALKALLKGPNNVG